MVTRIGTVEVGGFYARTTSKKATAFRCTHITARWIHIEQCPSIEDQIAGIPLAVAKVVSVPVAAWRSLTPIPSDDPRVILLP